MAKQLKKNYDRTANERNGFLVKKKKPFYNQFLIQKNSTIYPLVRSAASVATEKMTKKMKKNGNSVHFDSIVV